MTDRVEFEVAIFGQNERGRIAECLTSIAAAAAGRRTRITVIINGSHDGSAGQARATGLTLGLPITVYTIPFGDKANAINTFWYDLRGDAEHYVFVDAYVTISPESLAGIARTHETRPDVNVTTGIAINGRTEAKSARVTLEQGGTIHGQLYAMPRGFLDRITALGIRLPVGLYRGDSIIGTMACHDLDPPSHPWTNAHLLGVAEATYAIDTLSIFRPADIRRQFRRKIRQMRGVLENEAVKTIIYAGGYTALPGNADDMIRQYIDQHGIPRVALPDRPFLSLALRHHRASTPPDPGSLRPVRLSAD